MPRISGIDVPQNKRTEIVKNPKVYFFDTGLRNATISDFRKFLDRPDAGALLENGLDMEILKKKYDVHFWRDKKQHEMDFIINRGNRDIIALESKSYLKSSSTPSAIRFGNTYPDIPVYWSYAHIDSKLKGKIKNAFPVYMF